MPNQTDRRRSWLEAGAIVAAILSLLAMAIGMANDMYLHDRPAMRAFSKWRLNPTAENERLWQEARYAAMGRDVRFKGICFGLAAVFGFAAWRFHRVARALRSNATDRPASASTPGSG